MKRLTGVLILLLLLGFAAKEPVAQNEWTIPRQTFNPWSEMALTKMDTLTVQEFVMTRQVTLGEYRKYLDAVKRDSSYAYYKSQLPDSTMCTPSAYTKYLQSHRYDRFPVCGVTWVSAANYCRWKAIQDHLPDSMEYRLPYMEEWLAAYRHVRAENLSNDFNRNYSDWLMNAFDESAYDFMEDMDFSYAYPDNPDDAPVLRRKRFIGNSFHFQHENLGGFFSEYGYSFHGYAYVSFRMAKVSKTRAAATFLRANKKKKK